MFLDTNCRAMAALCNLHYKIYIHLFGMTLRNFKMIYFISRILSVVLTTSTARIWNLVIGLTVFGRIQYIETFSSFQLQSFSVMIG